MKIIIIAVFTLFTLIGNAQDNQLKNLETIDNTLTLTGWSIYEADGDRKGRKNSLQSKIRVVSNAIGQKTGIEFVWADKDLSDGFQGFPYTVKNHHTQPSFFYAKESKKARLFLEGYYYELKMNDPNVPEKFELEVIYVPEVATSAPAGKKLSFKEKMAAAKAELKNMPMKEGDLPKFLKEKDHIQLITEYLLAMKIIQEKATANFNETEKSELAELVKADADRENYIKNKNDAYWASEEGQRHKASMNGNKGKASKYTVVNTKSTAVRIGGNGWSENLNPGDSYKAPCNRELYYKVKSGGSFENAGLISDGINICGKTLKL